MQQSQQTVIDLYKCSSCARQVFMVDMEMGMGCKCGSRKVCRLQPSLFAVLHYLWRNPSALRLYWKENVLGRVS